MGLSVSKVAAISSTGAPGLGQERLFPTGQFGARKPRLRVRKLSLISRWQQSDQVRLNKLLPGRLT
jgi:hypothetical protein